MAGTVLGFGRASYEQGMKFLLSWNMHSDENKKMKAEKQRSDSDKSSEFGPTNKKRI